MAEETTDITAGKQAGTKRTFRTLETAFFQFEKEGDSIEGFLVNVDSQRMRQNSDGSPNVIGKYRVQLDDGADEPNYVEFLGGTDIDAKLSEVNEGDFIRVEWVGTQRTGSGNTMKTYLVQVAE